KRSTRKRSRGANMAMRPRMIVTNADVHASHSPWLKGHGKAKSILPSQNKASAIAALLIERQKQFTLRGNSADRCRPARARCRAAWVLFPARRGYRTGYPPFWRHG